MEEIQEDIRDELNVEIYRRNEGRYHRLAQKDCQIGPK